jgi:iron complex outermembrane receptor protein
MFQRTQLARAAAACALGAAAPGFAQTQAAPASQVIEVRGQFLTPAAESATKVLVPIRDTPLSVTNYSGDFMKAVESSDTADLYRYMTGVNRGGQSAYDLSLRGFKTTSNDRNALMTDGLPGQVSRFASPPTVGIERIEVVKGPASVLYGQAQPGGFVNVILKKPEDDRLNVIDLKLTGYQGDKISFGDRMGGSVAGDFTGPIDAGETLLYRLVVEAADRKGWRDFTFDRSEYVAPSFKWNIGRATSLTLMGEYRHRRGAQDLYLPAPNRDVALIPSRTTRLQEPDDYIEEEGYSFSVHANHAFSKELAWRFSARGVRNHDFTKWYDTVSVLPNLTTLQRRARIGDNNRKSLYADTSISYSFSTGPVKHKLLFGLTAGKDDLDANRIQFVNGATTGAASVPGPSSLNINIYNPVYGVSPKHESLPAGTFQRRVTASKPVGAYLTDFLTLSDQWKATLGVRYAKERQTFEELRSSSALLPARSATPSDAYPMAGVLFQPTKQLTVYGSYATSFVPIAPNMQDASGVFSFKPEEGRQYEVGVKGELMGGRLYFTVGAFDIEKVNTLALVTCNTGIAGTCMQPVGAETSKGVEIEVNLRPSRQWQTVFGYSCVDAKIKRSNSSNTAPLEGSQLTNAPKQKANLWSRYDFGGALEGVGVGGGITYVSDQAGNLPSRANGRVLRLPAYEVVDLALYWRVAKKYDFTLKAGNLFDKTYYDSVGSTLADLSIVPGAPRNLTLSARASF